LHDKSQNAHERRDLKIGVFDCNDHTGSTIRRWRRPYHHIIGRSLHCVVSNPVSILYCSLVHNRSLLPKIRIHVWGGLGSQLYAWYLAEALRVRHPNREFKFVFHSSGVTRRAPEIGQILSEFKYVFVDDFKENLSTSHNSGLLLNIRNLSKSYLKKLLDPVLINSRFNAELTNSRLWPWNFEIRGHYAHNKLDEAILRSMFNKALESGLLKLSPDLSEEIVLHMRLGDLTQLDTKGATDGSRVSRIINEIQHEFNIEKVLVNSDSPPQSVSAFLSVSQSSLDFSKTDAEAPQALSNFIACRCFIGTSSKLSFWAVLFRATLGAKISFLPIEHRDYVISIAPKVDAEQKIFFY